MCAEVRSVLAEERQLFTETTSDLKAKLLLTEEMKQKLEEDQVNFIRATTELEDQLKSESKDSSRATLTAEKEFLTDAVVSKLEAKVAAAETCSAELKLNLDQERETFAKEKSKFEAMLAAAQVACSETRLELTLLQEAAR